MELIIDGLGMDASPEAVEGVVVVVEVRWHVSCRLTEEHILNLRVVEEITIQADQIRSQQTEKDGDLNKSVSEVLFDHIGESE